MCSTSSCLNVYLPLKISGIIKTDINLPLHVKIVGFTQHNICAYVCAFLAFIYYIVLLSNQNPYLICRSCHPNLIHILCHTCRFYHWALEDICVNRLHCWMNNHLQWIIIRKLPSQIGTKTKKHISLCI